MIAYDYLVRRADIKEWHYVEDVISAEDAVVSAMGEGVIYTGLSVGVFFFDGLHTGNKYIAYRVKKIYIVSTEEYDCYSIRSIWSSREAAEDYMKQFPAEKHFNEIEERILDDPRELDRGVSDNKLIFFARLKRESLNIISLREEVKDIFNLNSLWHVRIDTNKDYFVTVAAKDSYEAEEKAKVLCGKDKENEGT